VTNATPNGTPLTLHSVSFRGPNQVLYPELDPKAVFTGQPRVGGQLAGRVRRDYNASRSAVTRPSSPSPLYDSIRLDDSTPDGRIAMFTGTRIIAVCLLQLTLIKSAALAEPADPDAGATPAAAAPAAPAAAAPAAATNSANPPATGARPNAQMKAVLDKLAKLGGQPIENLTPREARKQPTPADAVKALLVEWGKEADRQPVGKTDDREINAEGRDIPIRVYTPKGHGPFPVVVYYHGGGWVLATIDTYDASARQIADQARAVVVSVEYRKAPEHKFPAAHDDAFAAYQWVLQHVGELQGDLARIAVAGESAGGNLAAGVAMMARDRGVAPPAHQLLIYPVAGHDFETPSYRENANAKPLDAAMMHWFFGEYLRRDTDAADPRISLATTADLSKLPSATIITAQIDPLRSEGKALADKLRKAGVKVDYKNFDGVTHEFFGMATVLDAAKKAQALAGKDLTKAFAQAKKKSLAAAATTPTMTAAPAAPASP